MTDARRPDAGAADVRLSAVLRRAAELYENDPNLHLSAIAVAVNEVVDCLELALDLHKAAARAESLERSAAAEGGEQDAEISRLKARLAEADNEIQDRGQTIHSLEKSLAGSGMEVKALRAILENQKTDRTSEVQPMITNERQYRVTRAQAHAFQQAIAALTTAQPPADIHPRIRRAQQEALATQLQELQTQLQEYESMRSARDALSDAAPRPEDWKEE